MHRRARTQLGQHIRWKEKYNGHDLPGAGVCLLEDNSQSRRTPPCTMAGCGRSVPFVYHPFPDMQARTFDRLEFWGTDRVERLLVSWIR